MYLSSSLFLSLYVFHGFYLSISVSLSPNYLSYSLSVAYLSICLFLYIAVRFSIYLFIYLYIYLSIIFLFSFSLFRSHLFVPISLLSPAHYFSLCVTFFLALSVHIFHSLPLSTSVSLFFSVCTSFVLSIYYPLSNCCFSLFFWNPLINTIMNL